MMRSLFTAASGMQAQQRNIDTVAKEIVAINDYITLADTNSQDELLVF